MKILTKLAALALVGAFVFGFVACSDSEDDDKAIKGDDINFTWKSDKAQAAATAAGKKDTDVVYRSFKTLKTKHLSSDVIVTIFDAKTSKNSAKSRAGLGYVFGMEETTKSDDALKDVKVTVIDEKGNESEEKVKFYTFGVASVRYDITNSTTQWYLEWCNDVPNTCFNYTTNTTFKDKIPKDNGKEYGSVSPIVPDTDSWKNVSIPLIDADNDGEVDDLQVKLVITANDDGSYKVALQKIDGTKIDNGTIPATKTGFDKPTQKDIGRYFTAYNGQDAQGKIELENIAKSALAEDDGYTYGEPEELGIKGFVVR